MLSSALLALAVAAIGVNGSPVPKPQGVTALISPSAPAPSGCLYSYDGLFAIAAVKVEGVPIPSSVPANPQPVRRAVSQQSDGQPTVSSAALITQISDAQPQGPTTTPKLITQISDAQPQAPQSVSTMMHTAVSQIHDGQVQAIYTTMAVVTQISDAQPQAPVAPKTTSVISQISDAQPQAPTTTSVVSQISDAQPQAPSSTAKAVSQTSDAQPQVGTSTKASSTSASAAQPSVSMVACKTNSTLELDLKNGRLLDGKGRVGYIAANYQFQFDPVVPQTGAIITAGFSVCSNDTLALGGTTIFWQCLSGDFYNLYDRFWAPQCSPVNLRVVGLKDC